ncbi:haloalkane dehalogenase [bacterium]|nr:haloalkane dehalogenase [bacterium]
MFTIKMAAALVVFFLLEFFSFAATPSDISSDLTYESRYLEVFGSRIHYVESGQGDPILLLHGNPTWSYIWRNIMPSLSTKGRVVAVDLIGFGKSDKPDLEYRFEDHSRYLEEFIKRMELKNITLVLHDWGSALGFHYARRHGANVRGLVFFEALLLPLPSLELWPKDARELFEAFRTPDLGWDLVVRKNVFIEKRLQEGILRKLTDQEMNQYRNPFKDPESRKPIWRFPNELPIDGQPAAVSRIQEAYLAWLQTTKLPKLLLFASPGSLIPFETVEWARAHLKNLTSVYVGKGIHNLQEDLSVEIGGSIAAWMDRNLKLSWPNAPGILYVTNQSTLHLNCTGNGAPTVVLDAGVGEWSTHWHFVQQILKSEMRVCSYDRAGYGWSYPVPADPNAKAAANNLHQLLSVAGENGPFVLAGHSYGGYVNRLFAGLFPEDAAALIFVDSAHEDQWERIPETKELLHQGITSLEQMVPQMRSGSIPEMPMQDGRFPVDVAKTVRVAINHPARYETMLAESRHAIESASQVAGSQLPPEIPVIALSAGNSFAWFYEQNEKNTGLLKKLNETWAALQKSLAALSRRSKHRILEKATHNIVAEAPEETAGAIREGRTLSKEYTPSSKDSTYFKKMKEPGVKMVTIDGRYKVWTQRVGNGRHKVLLLHGGPGYTHEFLESFADHLPQAGIEIYFYEQLGCYFSDQPHDQGLWTLQRYVNEVEQVRRALGLEKFILFGYSWGGQLALQYAVKYPQFLKGLIVSNVSYSEEAIKARIKEVEGRIVRQNPDLLKEDTKRKNGLSYDSTYLKNRIDKIFGEQYYKIPVILKNESFSRSVRHRNLVVFDSVQEDLKRTNWSVWDQLPKISAPVLLMTGGEDYASSPEDVRKMCSRIQTCITYIAEKGSHLLFHDDPDAYFHALISFVKTINSEFANATIPT